MSFSDRVLGFGAFPNRDTAAYDVGQSVVLSGSQYLHRTPSSAGNQKTWTWSAWVKRSKLSSDYYLWSVYDGSTSSTYANLYFTSGDALAYGVWSPNQRVTNRVFRDTAAWYHIMLVLDTTQSTANDRIKIYVNGVQETSFSTTNNPSEDSDEPFNAAQKHVFGDTYALDPGGTSRWFQGYLAEVHFIDGTALTPSSFGETNSDTGQWVPKEVSGVTYGTNGFYLKFASGAIGTDSSGESNNYTTVSLSDTKVSLDSPTNNFPVLNPLWMNGTEQNTLNVANLWLTGQNDRYGTSPATMSVKEGAWYWEVYFGTSGDLTAFVGILRGTGGGNSIWPGSDPNDNVYAFSYQSGGLIRGVSGVGGTDGESIATGQTTYGHGNIIGCAVDIPNGTLKFYKDDSLVYTISSINTTYDWMPCVANWYSAEYAICNFGQNPSFYGSKTAGTNTDANGNGLFYYSVPTGYLALCSKNLSAPTITKPTDHFNTLLWEGNGSNARTLTHDFGWTPDLVWTKSRSSGASQDSHFARDVLRGFAHDKHMFPNQTYYEGQYNNRGAISTLSDTQFVFNSSASDYSTADGLNENNINFVAWNWLAGGSGSSNEDGSINTTATSANTTAGFSISTYTGTGESSNKTVGHGLGVAPAMIIVKKRGATGDWYVYHKDLTSNYNMLLNGTDGEFAPASTGWVSNPTSTTFQLSTGSSSNANVNSSATYVAYCFAEVDGYSRFGSFQGNNSADGTFVYTGFRPAWVVIKKASADGEAWYMQDSVRSPSNEAKLYSQIENVTAEYSAVGKDFVSNGFKIRNTYSGQNALSTTYIYMAFAESPFKYSNAR